jgi:dipeptidyl aminopeptidase/acylaminoacyl peptidase
MLDRNTGAVTLIDNAYHGVAAADVAAVSVINYTAADGRKLLAYLTLPNGKPAKSLPLIVLPHGGPAARDLPGFDWWAQALASRGYAVLQPQFRGSDGFGYDYLAAGFGEWGRKMQTDLSDGVRYLAAQGVIDAKRVCIVGASYGGYAALAGATMDHGVYRCAVADAPVSDPHTLLQWIQTREHESDSLGLRFSARFMGAQDADDPRLSEISPLGHAASADIPVLLIHGKDDTVVPYKQSQAMADALKAAGKPVTLVTLDGEDHWLSRSATRQQMLQATVTFLEANNPPN